MDLNESDKWALMNMVQIIVSVLDQPQSILEIVSIFGSEEMTHNEIRDEVVEKVAFLEERNLIHVKNEIVTLNNDVRQKIMAVPDVKDVGPVILKMIVD